MHTPYTVYDRIVYEIPAKNTVHKLYIYDPGQPQSFDAHVCGVMCMCVSATNVRVHALLIDMQSCMHRFTSMHGSAN